MNIKMITQIIRPLGESGGFLSNLFDVIRGIVRQFDTSLIIWWNRCRWRGAKRWRENAKIRNSQTNSHSDQTCTSCGWNTRASRIYLAKSPTISPLRLKWKKKRRDLAHTYTHRVKWTGAAKPTSGWTPKIDRIIDRELETRRTVYSHWDDPSV